MLYNYGKMEENVIFCTLDFVPNACRPDPDRRKCFARSAPTACTVSLKL